MKIYGKSLRMLRMPFSFMILLARWMLRSEWNFVERREFRKINYLYKFREELIGNVKRFPERIPKPQIEKNVFSKHS